MWGFLSLFELDCCVVYRKTEGKMKSIFVTDFIKHFLLCGLKYVNMKCSRRQ